MTGEDLEVKLEKAGMTKTELARRVGVSRRYVQMWCGGEVPEKWWLQIAAALVLRPNIRLGQQERIETAQILEKVAMGTPISVKERGRAMRLRDKLRASVGGGVPSNA